MLEDSIEEWRPIERSGGHYEVSDHGHVRRAVPGKRTWAGRVLQPRRSSKGYLSIGMWVNEQKMPVHIHRLVAETFLGPPPTPLHQVNHRDGVKDNNRPDNLEWVTSAENHAHARRIGLSSAWGQHHPAAKLTERQVKAIRKVSREFSAREIGEVLGISASTIKNARNGNTWRHVAPSRPASRRTAATAP